MNITIPPGRYVLAVSGGVDSMVLLDIARQLPGVELVVAHFDHGVRSDSAETRTLVEETAKRYSLLFVCEEGNLGAHVSEAQARDARYDFLRRAQSEHNAQAIITAHHQDDLVETAVLNILRGTGRKGLSSLRSTEKMIRPLLHVGKQDVLAYARQHNIVWHEDSTNQSDNYLRNYIRHHVLPRLGGAGKQQLLEHIAKAESLNPAIDALLSEGLAGQQDDQLQRQWFIMLPHAVACEVMASWLRQHGVLQFDRKAIDRLVVAAKTAQPGKQIDVNAGYLLKVSRRQLLFAHNNIVKTE